MVFTLKVSAGLGWGGPPTLQALLHTLRVQDGAKLEMRHVGPNFPDIYKYIYDRLTPAAQEDSFTIKEKA